MTVKMIEPMFPGGRHINLNMFVLIVMAMAIAMMTGCAPEPVYQQAPDDQAYAEQDDDHSDALLAGAAAGVAGYMLGKKSQPKHSVTIVKQRVIVKQQAPVYAPPRAAMRPREVVRAAPAPSRSYRPSFSSRRR